MTERESRKVPIFPYLHLKGGKLYEEEFYQDQCCVLREKRKYCFSFDDWQLFRWEGRVFPVHVLPVEPHHQLQVVQQQAGLHQARILNSKYFLSGYAELFRLSPGEGGDGEDGECYRHQDRRNIKFGICLHKRWKQGRHKHRMLLTKYTSLTPSTDGLVCCRTAEVNCKVSSLPARQSAVLSPQCVPPDWSASTAGAETRHTSTSSQTRHARRTGTVIRGPRGKCAVSSWTIRSAGGKASPVWGGNVATISTAFRSKLRTAIWPWRSCRR